MAPSLERAKYDGIDPDTGEVTTLGERTYFKTGKGSGRLLEPVEVAEEIDIAREILGIDQGEALRRLNKDGTLSWEEEQS